MGLFQRRSSGVLAPILTGVGGLLLGAGIVSLLTPRTGAQLRGMVRDLFTKLEKHNDQHDLERMEGEGGVAHVVTPPLDGSRPHSHS